MDRQLWEMFGKASFFFSVGVILASLFLWSMVEGISLHLAGLSANAFVYYFIGFMSGVGGLALYFQAKYIFHMAKISG